MGKCKLRQFIFVFGVIFSFACSQAPIHKQDSKQGKPLTIAVASNFYLTAKLLLATHPYYQNVKLVSGSSGTLYAQAKNGAPFDVYLAANSYFPQQLYKDGLSNKPVDYAQGKLVLYPVATGKSLEEILKQSNRIAIANPDIAPYGMAAKQILERNLVDNTKLVFANNVSQAFQFVDTGNVDTAFLAQSLLYHAHQQSKRAQYSQYLLLPLDTYNPIMQQATIMLNSNKQALAQDFLEYLVSKEVQEGIANMGYLAVNQKLDDNK